MKLLWQSLPSKRKCFVLWCIWLLKQVFCCCSQNTYITYRYSHHWCCSVWFWHFISKKLEMTLPSQFYKKIEMQFPRLPILIAMIYIFSLFFELQWIFIGWEQWKATRYPILCSESILVKCFLDKFALIQFWLSRISSKNQTFISLALHSRVQLNVSLIDSLLWTKSPIRPSKPLTTLQKHCWVCRI